jgi:ribosome recycling factor
VLLIFQLEKDKKMHSSKRILNNLLRRRLQNPTMVNKTLTIRPIAGMSSRGNGYFATKYNEDDDDDVKKSSRLVSFEMKRWRHSGKMGSRLETLDELAHEPEREAAQERRKKKKERNASKRKGKKGADADASEEPEQEVAANLEDDELLEDDDVDYEDGLEDEDGEEEPTLPDVDRVKSRMATMIGKFEESLKSIRGAEPNADMFDDVQVNAYGSMTPLKAVGQVVIVSATLAQITCFDPAVGRDVSKAVQLALSLNPQLEEGGMVKVPLPRVSMEIREQTAKQLKKKAESCRQRLRTVRRKAMDLVKKGKDGKLAAISKDDAFTSGKEVEAATESAMNALQEVVDKKMDSIMAV